MGFRHILTPAVVQSGVNTMHIYDLINNQDTYRTDGAQTVLEVVEAMVARNIGAVPVLESGILVGIFSERDLMRRVVAEGRDPRLTRIRDVMTKDPLTVSPRETVENCMILMRRHGFRHLPICDGQQLLAVVSLRDVLLHDLTEKDHEVRMMRAYIQASPQM
jgi:signal-transduction protein with cAMP-binding, CBS, and nucleotidyltransferase domain